MPHGQIAGALMGRFETRITRLEASPLRSRRPGISGERRKALTDRAVFHWDLDALQELSLYRPDKITCQQGAALRSPCRRTEG